MVKLILSYVSVLILGFGLGIKFTMKFADLDNLKIKRALKNKQY